MADSTRPFLVLYIVWHPDFADGTRIAEALRNHYRRELYENVAGGTGLSVIYRTMPAPGAAVPLPIDFEEAETTAVVVLADENLAQDECWRGYIAELVDRADEAGLATRVFPVAIEHSVLTELNLLEQAVRWDRHGGELEQRCQYLVGALTYEFCRMLRHYLEHLERPEVTVDDLQAYLKKVQIFLSHSKHDENGVRIALAIRERLGNGHSLSSFFDVHDIPAGLRFNKVLLDQVKVGAMVAIHTDSYSSREWCRKEVIEAKRHNVPLIVANSIADADDRGFPYLGNVPVVRLDPDNVERIESVINRLLDEVLKDFLWKCRVKLAGLRSLPNVFLVPRPPELISLVNLPSATEIENPVIVYPDPPLSAEEERLFASIAPRVQLRSLNEWIAGAVR